MRCIVILLAAAVPGAALCGQWIYASDTDKMTSKVTRAAYTVSDNSLDLAFPYKGRNTGRLTVREHPRYGQQVIFDVDKGQIMCHSHSGCSILIRFDEKPPRTFAGAESADHDSTVVFVRDTRGFIAEAKKAKRILVQVQFFQNGSQTLEFTAPNPLVWPQPIAAAKH